ncbi:MAG: hypothetical protein AMJ79_14750 [Phycisphaerae bacterium SM23_30]|nr:MAG: hypothetical protein AMJ79_14750 [Phycisphaerae bacterium SM23_30]
MNSKWPDLRELNPRWSDLRGWGHSRLLQTSYIWIIIVPLAAKILLPIAGDHVFTVFGSRINIHFGLPFSWKLFYFMAISFTIALAFYTLRCPEMLRTYHTFREYRAEHKGIGPMLGWLNWTISRLDETRMGELLERITNAFRIDADIKAHNILEDTFNRFRSKRIPKSSLFKLYKDLLVSSTYGEDVLSDLFDAIGRSQEHLRKKSLVCSVFFFFGGFLFFLIVMIQNFIFVIRAMLA